MDNIVIQIADKIKSLNLNIKDLYLSEKIILMAINSVKNFIKYEINPFIDFCNIKDVFIDCVIAEYLSLVKASKLENDLDTEEAIQTIKEGDVSITYFENQRTTIDDIIKYYEDKKRLLYNFKKVVW